MPTARQPPCPIGPQMDVGPEATAALLQWLLGDAPPVQRSYFLTSLGRLEPRPLGAALFGGLLAAGQPERALRLVHHAAALSDDQLAVLVRRHLIDDQDAREAAPTWRRQSWQRLAVARPQLALQLLGELWSKVQEAVPVDAKQNSPTATVTVGAAYLTRRGVPACWSMPWC